MIFVLIDKGSYQIKLEIGVASLLDCPTVTLELEIVPDALVQQRTAAFQCSPGDGAPEIDFSSLATKGHSEGFMYSSYVSRQKLYLSLAWSPERTENEVSGVRFAKSYEFTVPQSITSGPVTSHATLPYNFRAVLGAPFLYSGTLGLLLVPKQLSGKNGPENLSLDHCRHSQHPCDVASSSGANQLSMSTLLDPGTYVLWIFDHSHSHNGFTDLPLSCMPFDLTISIQPYLHGESSWVECEGSRLPSSFNQVGFLSPEGYLHLHTIVSMVQSNHPIDFMLEEHSVLRAIADYNGQEVSMVVSDSTNVIASSSHLDTVDSLFTHLPAHTPLTLTIQQTEGLIDRFNVCHDFILHLEIVPLSRIDASQNQMSIHSPSSRVSTNDSQNTRTRLCSAQPL